MSESAPVPLITIGLTCFNAAGTIRRALDSAFAQDWPHFEIIVVDDASTDGSAAIVRAAIAGRPQARLIVHQGNTGPAGARNTILAAARGEIVVFFDDDDESLPERLRLQYRTLREYERVSGASLVACYASGARRYPNGYELPLTAIGSQPEVPRGDEVADYLLFNERRPGVYYGSGTPACSLMARLSVFRAIGGFDAGLRRVEDVDFAIRLAQAGGHFVGCPERLFLQHATVAADKAPRRNLEAELALVEKHAGYLQRRRRYGYARDWFTLRYFHFSGQRLRFLAASAAFLLRHPLAGARHFMRSLPRRWRHERRMHGRAG